MLREVADAQALRRVAHPRQRREFAGNRAQQGRFAGAVRTEQADAFAGEQRPVDVRENPPLAVTERDVLEPHELAGLDLGGAKLERERTVDVRGRDQLHALERLDPALRLLGLGGLGAKAIDVAAQMGDLFLLLRMRRLLQGERLRVFALEGRVVTRVGVELVAVDMNDPRHHGIEEVAIVGDQQQRARVTLQPIFEPQYGVEVEVVGRLVEEQQVGARHQRLREIEPHAPAAGEARHRVFVTRGREAESRQQRSGARTGAVTVRDLEAMMQLREFFTAGVGIGGVLRSRLGDVAFDGAQFRVAVEDVVDRRLRRRRGFLGHVRNDPGRGDGGVAGIGDELAAQQREQARLAAAVGADDTDFLPRVHRQGRAFQQPPGTASEGQVGNSNHDLKIGAEEGKALRGARDARREVARDRSVQR